MNELMNGYKALFSCMDVKECSPSKLTCFVAMRGEKYDSLQDRGIPRLMIIGRAVNGWNRENLIYESADTFAESALKCFNDNTRYTTEWGLNSCKNGEYYSVTGDVKYYLSQSPFWNYSRSVWKNLVQGTEIEDDPDWLQYIVWSNLYKISPRYGGNPDNKLCQAQAEACINILRTEIRLLNPTHILMPVANGWLSWEKGDFSKIFTDGLIGTKELDISTYEQHIVKRVFLSDHLKVVVTNRPERRKRESYVKVVMIAYNNIK